MINNIINLFKKQAYEHKTIKAFVYGRKNEMGSGKDTYPLFWLEDPVYGQNMNNVFRNTVNFSILFLLDKEKNVREMQNLAFSVGLNIIERIKLDKVSGINILPDWSYLTLQNYTDDDACGCRFTLNFTQVNMQALCLIEEQFELGKVFKTNKSLPEIEAQSRNNCEIFSSKFPVFNLKTRK